MGRDKLVAVGRIVKPHGVAGELCVEVHADSLSYFGPGRSLTLSRPGGPERIVTVLAARPHQNRLLLTVEGVADRDAAEALRGAELAVAAGALPPLADDEIYLHEIEGFAVLGPDGREIGVMAGVLDAPAVNVWVIRAPDGREILFPANADTVTAVDADARTIRVAPPEGLLDLY